MNGNFVVRGDLEIAKIGSLARDVFFLFNFSSHYHFYIVRNLFTSRDDYLQNLGETTVVACEMFTSGFRPWLKKRGVLKLVRGTRIRAEEPDSKYCSNAIEILCLSNFLMGFMDII